MANNECLNEQGLTHLIQLLHEELERYATLEDLKNLSIDEANGIESIEQTTTSTEDGGTNIITVTLTNGETATFQNQNGSKGSRGEPGYTPRKDVDYWTEADKAEIVSAVLANFTDVSEVGA